MCGIAGYIGPEKIVPEAISNTLARMVNRGPDNRQTVCIEESGRNIYLLHTRLSIIDLDPRANQPFERNGVWLVFNGEIYNYKEIRSELERAGVVFHTSSDTEVLIEAYCAWGEECVHKFEGMWAFALYDTRRKKLFLSRDRFAEKPLYLFADRHGGLYFGSEIKFLSSLAQRRFTVNEQHVLRYLVNGYKSLYKKPETYFKEISEVPFASNVVVDAHGRVSRHRYWQPRAVPQSMSFDEAVEGTREKLLESMRLRLRADVPLAFCLSGGVDSASLTSIAAKVFNYDVATFSIIDSDERYNEYDNIKATVDDLGCRNTLIHLDYGNTLQDLRDLVAYHDAPVATITYLVHSYLEKAIHQAGYRVAFSGTSADELFTGYYDHFYLHLYEMREHPDFEQFLADWQKHTGTFVRNPFFKNAKLYFDDPEFRGHIYFNNDLFRSYFTVPFAEEFSEEPLAPSLLRNRMLNELFYEITPVILHEDDHNAMKYSIENRSPFLDRALFDFAYSIPAEYLIGNGYAKKVLREAMKGVLNETVRLDRRKKGFNASITSVINFEDKKNLDYLMSDSPIYRLVDREKIKGLFRNEPLEDSLNKFLFSFINAKIFLEEQA